MRFRLDSSRTSKSANFNLPHVRSMAKVMANALPTDSPAIPTFWRAVLLLEVILLQLRLVRTAMKAASGNNRTHVCRHRNHAHVPNASQPASPI